MTLTELGFNLKEMYMHANKGEAVAMIHVFGIKFAHEIIDSGQSILAIATAAGISNSYATEISKGVKLANFVSLKAGVKV